MSVKLVKAAEIRVLLNLDTNSRVYDLARRAILPGVVRIGRQVRFDLDKVLEFVDSGGKPLPGGWRVDVPEAAGHEMDRPEALSSTGPVISKNARARGEQ